MKILRILALALLLSAPTVASAQYLIRSYVPGTSGASTPFTACRTSLVDGAGTMVFTGSNGALVSKVGC